MLNPSKILDTEQIKSFNTLDTIFSMDRDEASRIFSPYFVKYHVRLFREQGYLNCILNYVKWWSDVLDVQEKDVLDIGCGFGIYTTMFSFFGANRVYGADHNDEKIEMFKKVLSIIDPPLEKVEPSLQDGLRLSFDDASFEAIFVKDVISHVRDLKSFLKEVFRLLKPGGQVLITDENNALEIAGKRERREKWNMWEFEGVPSENLRGGEPPLTYREMRREDISDHIKNLEIEKLPGYAILLKDKHKDNQNREAILNILAERTRGFWGESLLRATDDLLEKGHLKTKPEFPYRHPRTGEFMEREFNPFQLADQMVAAGISTRVIRPKFFTQKPLLNIAGMVISAAHPLSIYVQPNFYLLGTKR